MSSTSTLNHNRAGIVQVGVALGGLVVAMTVESCAVLPMVQGVSNLSAGETNKHEMAT